jgi:hypothetical protein
VSVVNPAADAAPERPVVRPGDLKGPGLRHTLRSRTGWDRNNPFAGRSEQMSDHWSTNAHLLGAGR